MGGSKTLEIPAVARDLAGLFDRDGFNLWLVGGWVRDALLGVVHTDLDFATDARPVQTKRLLGEWSAGRTWETGIDFGTIGAERKRVRVEVTTLRRELYQEDSRKPRVSFADDLETDLSRRDFTVNALAIALPGGELIDPFEGRKDLEARTIRTPLGPEVSFSDDPLRMLRALRLVSTLEFRLEPDVVEAIRSMHDRLSIVSRERIREEFSKLLGGKAPSKALELATSTGLAGEFLPELPALRLTQDPVHRHKDLFRHTLAVLDNVCALEAVPDLETRLAALFHDVGKPKTRRITPEGVSFHHHEIVGAEMAEARLKALRYPARTVDEVKELVSLHMRFHTYRLGWSDRAVRRYVRDAGPLLGKLNTLVRADCTTRNAEKAQRLARRMDELEARIRELAASEELARLRPALNGDEVMEHLGIGRGPLIGEALSYLMEIRLDEGEISKEEAYRRLDEWWRERNGEA
ncbi:MAG: CCA tRNA nucleotidyltransferase [Actinomycetota bacterium]